MPRMLRAVVRLIGLLRDLVDIVVNSKVIPW